MQIHDTFSSEMICQESCARPVFFLPPAYVVRREGNSFTLLVCPQGGGGQVQPGGRGGQVSQPTGGGSGPAGEGGSGPAGGVRSSQGGSGQSADGGGSGPAGGGVRSVSRGGGQVQPAGGVSILRPLAGSMPLAFTQEDFLVVAKDWHLFSLLGVCYSSL